MKLSILMPVYNENKWLEKVVHRVLLQEVPGITDREIILVDDKSTDGTTEVVRSLGEKFPEQVRVFFHDENRGKGSAIQTAIKEMTGDLCIIQDADWEYSPSDYPAMLIPIIHGIADCVYGSRFTGSECKRVLFFWHSVGNHFLTLLSNMFTNLNLTDMETGYKAFRCEILKAIPLKSKRFGFEPEITAKISRHKFRIYEVGISYQGRTYEEGKKITWKDGIQAVLLILRFGLIRD